MTRTAKRAPGGARKQQTGWHKEARLRLGATPFCADAGGPTRWERMLRGLGVTEAEALHLLAELQRLSVGAAAIRQWVRQHCWAAYVPEPVLAALGLGDKDVCVYRDSEACAEAARTTWAARRAQPSAEKAGQI